MTKEFIIKTLLPYKENPELKAYKNGTCEYLTIDGKKCAIGQYMKEGKWQTDRSGVGFLFQDYSETDIMNQEWINQDVPISVSVELQEYHDSLGIEPPEDMNEVVNRLEELTGFNLNELRL